MTAPELKAKLTEFGVPYSEDAKKADLQRIHDEASEAGVFSGEQSEVVAETPKVESATPEEESAEEVEEVEEAHEHPMSTYTVVSRLDHDCVAYEPGDSVVLPIEVARHLLVEKVVK